MKMLSKKFGWMVGGLFMFCTGVLLSPVQANVCSQDIETYCGNIQAGNGVAECLEYNNDKVSLPCRQALKKLENSIKELKIACGFDVVNYCRDVKPGYGRVKTCLMNNLDKLSNSCQMALKKPLP